MSESQLQDIVDRGDTDTAYQAFVAVKASKELQEKNPGLTFGDPRLRATSTKRKRKEEGHETPSRRESIDRPPVLEKQETAEMDVPVPMSIPTEELNSATNSLWNDMFGGMNSFNNGLSSTTIADPVPRVPTPPFLWGGYPAYPADPAFSLSQFDTKTPSAVTVPTPYPSLSMQNNSYALNSQQGGFGLTLPGQIPLFSTTRNTEVSPAEASPANESSPGAILASRQKHLRSAIAKATKYEGQGSLPGVMTPEQIEARRLVQEELHESIKDDQVPDSDRKVEAAQLISYHLNKWVSL